MTRRLDAYIRCTTCGIAYGTVYAELVNADAYVWAHVCEPVEIPPYCTTCQKPLTRVNP